MHGVFLNISTIMYFLHIACILVVFQWICRLHYLGLFLYFQLLKKKYLAFHMIFSLFTILEDLINLTFVNDVTRSCMPRILCNISTSKLQNLLTSYRAFHLTVNSVYPTHPELHSAQLFLYLLNEIVVRMRLTIFSDFLK